MQFMLRRGHGGLYTVSTIEESERLRVEGDQMKLIDLRFERWQVVGFRRVSRRKDVDKSHVLGMSNDLFIDAIASSLSHTSSLTFTSSEERCQLTVTLGVLRQLGSIQRQNRDTVR